MTEDIDHSRVKVIPLEVHNVKQKFKMSDFSEKLMKALKERQKKVDYLTKEREK